MRTIKQKEFGNEKAKTASKIQPVIVINGYTLRPVKLASSAFRNRTFYLSLFTNANCSFSEMHDVARFLANTFRKIIHNDVAYQQKLNNLPSFVGVRNICFRPLVNCEFSPYIVVELDNIQAAVFVARSWCKRTGQTPHSINYLINKGANVEAVELETHKSTPLLIESIIVSNWKNINSLTFGSAVAFSFRELPFAAECYPVPGVRVSQSFGCHQNVHTGKRIKELYEAKQAGYLERLRREHSKSVAYIEFQRRKKELQISHIHRSEYGAAKVFGCGTRYERAREKYVASLHLNDAKTEALAADGVPVEAQSEHRYTRHDREIAETLGVELNVDIEEKKPTTSKRVEVEQCTTLTNKQIAQRKRQLKKAIKESFERNNNQAKEWADIHPVEVAAFVDKIKQVCDVEVEANGQIVLRF